MRPSRRYLLPLGLALGVHGALLFALPEEAPYHPPEFAMEPAPQGVEVELVAAAPAAVEAAAAPEPPSGEPEPPAPEPEPPAPEPEPPAPEPEPPIAEATPEPPPAAPQATPAPPAATPPPPRARPAPRRKASPAPHPATPRSGSAPGLPTAEGSSGTPGTPGGGALTSRPSHYRNPHPAYPEAARHERQEGVVILHIRIDELGQVTSVRIATSSGFPLLDERALSTVRERWRFHPARRGNVAVPAELTLPIRFTLGR